VSIAYLRFVHRRGSDRITSTSLRSAGTSDISCNGGHFTQANKKMELAVTDSRKDASAGPFGGSHIEESFR